MLIYALSRDTNKLEHIDSVANGLKCNCFCSGCNDSLVARNNCSPGRRNHFSHHSKDENRNCLMTQLHLAAQHHFLNAKHITLPEVSFLYKGKYLNRSAIGLKVLSAQLETKIDHYYADVTIETNIGTIVIEVCVTHKNELDKTAHYQKNKIASIEYDLGPYLSKDIDEAINDLSEYKVESAWLYEWCRDELIQEHEAFLIEEKIRIQKKRTRSARDSAKKFTHGKYILLPSLVKTFKHTINEKTYTDDIVVFTRRVQAMTEVVEVAQTTEYLLLKGTLQSQIVWIAFLLQTEIPDAIQELNGSVIVRIPAISESNRAIWSWFKYPKLIDKINYKKNDFIKDSVLQNQQEKTTHTIMKSVINNSELYILYSDSLFKRDYGLWAVWMQNQGLFEKTQLNSNPKLPYVLNYIKQYPCLWVFSTWHILTLSYLAEIVDNEPKNSKIFYTHIFNKLAHKIGVHSDFLSLEKKIAPLAVSSNHKNLILREFIIESALQPFANTMDIHCLDKCFIRKGSLLASINLK